MREDMHLGSAIPPSGAHEAYLQVMLLQGYPRANFVAPINLVLVKQEEIATNTGGVQGGRAGHGKNNFPRTWEAHAEPQLEVGGFAPESPGELAALG